MLTKTDYILYRESAPLHLWAFKHGRAEKQENVFLDMLADEGYKVEELAEEYMKSLYKDVEIQMTRKDGDFEARSDILVKNPETDKYDIYEVKASSKVKPKHLYDLAFQYLVFAEHFEVGDLYVLHPDKHYVRNGELDLEEFFDARDVTAEVLELLDEVRLERASALKVIAAESPEGIEHC